MQICSAGRSRCVLGAHFLFAAASGRAAVAGGIRTDLTSSDTLLPALQPDPNPNLVTPCGLVAGATSSF